MTIANNLNLSDSEKSDARHFTKNRETKNHVGKHGRMARAILDARTLYPDCSLADLYDETVMPPELRTAHQNNDRAVMQAYGFDVKSMTESSCVAALMKLYVRLVEQKG